jgi:hypothetical protein
MVISKNGDYRVSLPHAEQCEPDGGRGVGGSESAISLKPRIGEVRFLAEPRASIASTAWLRSGSSTSVLEWLIVSLRGCTVRLSCR